MPDVFADVVGQERAVAMLRASAVAPVHAYLLVGPPGVGLREGARGFAAALLCDRHGCGECRHCRLALAEAHPDLVFTERTGAAMRVGEIEEVLRLAARSPRDAARQVLVLVDVHLIIQEYPRLLKALEEPPPTTVFVLLADDVPPDLMTVASRCVRVDFGPIPDALVASTLVSEGVPPEIADEVAAAAAGRVDRARLLAGDAGFSARQAAWRSVPGRLDGSGAAIASMSRELLAAIDTVVEPLERRQVEELEQVADRQDGRRDMEARHRREVRRIRTDELRFGLGTLARAYRDRMATADNPAASADAIRAIEAAATGLVRNPNETLLLEALLVRLTSLRG